MNILDSEKYPNVSENPTILRDEKENPRLFKLKVPEGVNYIKFQEAVSDMIKRFIVPAGSTDRVALSTLFSIKPYDIARGDINNEDLET